MVLPAKGKKKQIWGAESDRIAILERVAREDLWQEGILTEAWEKGGGDLQVYLEEEDSKPGGKWMQTPLNRRVPELWGKEQHGQGRKMMGEMRKSSVREVNWFPQGRTAGLSFEAWSF